MFNDDRARIARLVPGAEAAEERVVAVAPFNGGEVATAIGAERAHLRGACLAGNLHGRPGAVLRRERHGGAGFGR